MSTEVRTTSSTGGQKGMKLERFDLIPIEALTELARHYGRGAEKYDDNQWRKGYEWSKSYAALQRHITAWWNGENIDEETGSTHLAAVAWHAFTLMTFEKDFPQFDDRYVKPDADYDDPYFDFETEYVDPDLNIMNVFQKFFGVTPDAESVDVPENGGYDPGYGPEDADLLSPPYQVGDVVNVYPVTLEGPAGSQSFTLVMRANAEV